MHMLPDRGDKPMKTLKEYCQMNVDSAEEAKKRLINNIESNALNALEWAERDIEIISLGDICFNVLRRLEKGETEDEIIAHATEEILIRAQ